MVCRCGILIFSYRYSLSSAKSHLEHSHTWLGIDHLEVLAYLWQSTGVSLCSDKRIGQGRGAEARVIVATAPSRPMRGQLGSIYVLTKFNESRELYESNLTNPGNNRIRRKYSPRLGTRRSRHYVLNRPRLCTRHTKHYTLNSVPAGRLPLVAEQSWRSSIIKAFVCQSKLGCKYVRLDTCRIEMPSPKTTHVSSMVQGRKFPHRTIHRIGTFTHSLIRHHRGTRLYDVRQSPYRRIGGPTCRIVQPCYKYAYHWMNDILKKAAFFLHCQNRSTPFFSFFFRSFFCLS